MTRPRFSPRFRERSRMHAAGQTQVLDRIPRGRAGHANSHSAPAGWPLLADWGAFLPVYRRLLVPRLRRKRIPKKFLSS